jgi:MFS-type transporter involved in bile tolerance (Atg22 family)
MNWTRVLVGGVVAGIVVNLADFVLHGMIMAETYKKYDTVFSQTQANPMYFFAAAILVGIFVAALFAKSRGSWAEGWKGGATFGLFFGLATFFFNFYNPLVIADFPYFLSWCWGGIGLIDSVIGGAVLGVIVKR